MKRDSSHIRKILVVSNTHWDREFRHSFEKTRRHLLDMLDTTLDILEKDPDYPSFTMDGHGIARAAIESVAENLTDGVFSTLFWASAGCLAGGASGAASAALAHRVFNILDAMWGKKNDRYRHFGTFAARTDDALNFIPARLILPCISFSSLMVKGTSARRALTMGWAFRNAHASPNSAWSEAAFAGALGLRLGGPVSYKGIPANYPWIGTGRTKASASDLALAIRLMWTTAVTGTLAFTLLLLFTPRL